MQFIHFRHPNTLPFLLNKMFLIFFIDNMLWGKLFQRIHYFVYCRFLISLWCHEEEKERQEHSLWYPKKQPGASSSMTWTPSQCISVQVGRCRKFPSMTPLLGAATWAYHVPKGQTRLKYRHLVQRCLVFSPHHSTKYWEEKEP